MSRLFITDLDGTLLDCHSRVSPHSAEIISALSRDGALISVATARTPATVEQLLAYTYTTIPTIVMTGAAMWERAARRYLNIRYHAESTVESVAQTLREEGISPFYYSISEDSPIVYCYHFGMEMSSKERKFMEERSRLPLKRIYHLPGGELPVEKRREIVLMFAVGDMDSIKRAAERIAATVDCSYSCYPDAFNRQVGYLEIFAPGVSKASAVERLKEMTKADSLTVYGDNLNDLPMMAVADESVAVSNALDEVKRHADRVIGPNTADSVALDIQSHLVG
ncbi:MAG: HAD family hydrolase [Paramuribaculum sp.]|nr:HAD family hydrolase [Paramuribaculum sp.]